MLDQCLILIPRLDWAFVNELLAIALYFPWFSFIATWLVSVAFYDGEMFFTNIFINYIVFSILYSVSRMTGIVSAMLLPCDSFFFDIYRYIFPSATFISTLAYYFLVVQHHRIKKAHWWKTQSSLSMLFFIIVLTMLPLGYITALWYYDIMGVDIMLVNFALVVLLVIAQTEFAKHNHYWKRSVSRINIYMGWKQ